MDFIVIGIFPVLVCGSLCGQMSKMQTAFASFMKLEHC